jgi:hypothetical protein
VLRWVAHGGSKASTLDVYSTLAWPTLCAEVARLRFELPTQAVPQGSVTESVAAEGCGGETRALLGSGAGIRT